MKLGLHFRDKRGTQRWSMVNWYGWTHWSAEVMQSTIHYSPMHCHNQHAFYLIIVAVQPCQIVWLRKLAVVEISPSWYHNKPQWSNFQYGEVAFKNTLSSGAPGFLLLTVVMQRVGPLDRLAKMLASETAWYSTVIYPQICGYKIKCEIWMTRRRCYSSICRSYRVVEGLEGFCWKWKESFLLQVLSLQKRLM